MKNYLLFTDVALSSDRVEQHLSRLDRAATVKVVVPIRPLNDGERTFIEIEDGPADDDVAPETRLATWRMRQAVSVVRGLGFSDVEGITAATSPVEAIENAVENESFDAVVVVTEPTGAAGWVHMDLAHRIERHVDEPVIHIEVEPANS